MDSWGRCRGRARGWALSATQACAVFVALATLALASPECVDLNIAPAVIRIVPEECGYWKERGRIDSIGANGSVAEARQVIVTWERDYCGRAKPEGIVTWERDCGHANRDRRILFSSPAELPFAIHPPRYREGIVTWERDCGRANRDRRILFFSSPAGGDAGLAVGSQLLTESEPHALSELGSQTEMPMHTCSGVESVVTESIFRGRILLDPTASATLAWQARALESLEYQACASVSLYQARASVALEYQVRTGSEAWNLTVVREPLAAFVFDFFISNGIRSNDVGDRVARVSIPLSNNNASSAYFGALC
ncbi:hypothetical protein T484DRAFT_1876453, partial [Baffinella frigidus]